MRTCSKCGRSEPAVTFYASRGYSECISCKREVCRQYYQDHREQRNTASIAWNKDNRARVNELAVARYRKKKAESKSL